MNNKIKNKKRNWDQKEKKKFRVGRVEDIPFLASHVLQLRGPI
jgi:hypothetical protein